MLPNAINPNSGVPPKLVLLTAGTALTAAVSAIIVRQMASALLERKPVDLTDEAACVDRLSQTGFGSRSIAALLDAARNKAVQWLATRDRNAGGAN